jgi:hypothetical protein
VLVPLLLVLEEHLDSGVRFGQIKIKVPLTQLLPIPLL